MDSEARQKYFDKYWQEQNPARVLRRSFWRAERLYRMVGDHYRSVLDVGAGQGELLSFFRWRGYKVIGWDISPQAVRNLRDSDFEAMLVDLEEEELSGEHELICCCEVLQQTNEPALVIRKLLAILTKGGRLCISTPNEFHLLRRLGLGHPVESHKTLFSPKRAKALARECGLAIERVVYQPLTPPRWGTMPNLVGAVAARICPALFSLSTIMLLRRENDC